jgi:hypothetical protein
LQQGKSSRTDDRQAIAEFEGGFKFRNEHHLCSGSRRGGCRGNDGS